MDTHHDYSGMTVNERLFAAKRLDRFDAYAKARDLGSMISILQSVSLSHAEATEIAKTILADPTRFGY